MTIIQKEKGPWTYLLNLKAETNKLELFAERDKEFHGTAGKYLFFSSNKRELIKLASTILEEFELYCAKVPAGDDATTYVLCVYDSCGRYRGRLKQYESATIAYRWWQSNRTMLERRERSGL